MKRIIWTRGAIAGGILAAMISLMPLSHCGDGTMDMETSELVGYTSMILAFLAVFFGVRSYREQRGGTITFGQAFKVGICITLIACAAYVISWQIVSYKFMPDFASKYATITIEKMRTEGASAAEIAKTQEQMATFQRLYANPFLRMGMTLMEVFPVGLIVTLISAAILRRKSTPGTGDAAPAAA